MDVIIVSSADFISAPPVVPLVEEEGGGGGGGEGGEDWHGRPSAAMNAILWCHYRFLSMRFTGWPVWPAAGWERILRRGRRDAADAADWASLGLLSFLSFLFSWHSQFNHRPISDKNLPQGTPWSILEHLGASWSILEHLGAFWSIPEHPRASLENPGAS